MRLEDIVFQYYSSNVRNVIPLGSINLRQFLNRVRNPKPEILGVYRQIAEAAEAGNLKLKDELKRNKLYSFTPSVFTDRKGRSLNNVIYYNPIMVVEFDKIDFAEELKHYIFHRYKSVIAAFLSPSRRGVKFIVSIPTPRDLDEYKAYYCGFAHHMEQIKGFDPANYNAILPLFYTFDRNMLERSDYETWTRKGEKRGRFNYKEIVVPTEKVVTNDKIKQEIQAHFEKQFFSIHDNGHGHVIRYSLILGGYVGQGYLNQFEAENMVEYLIENTTYLQKDVKGYKRTAKFFIGEGAKRPLSFRS